MAPGLVPVQATELRVDRAAGSVVAIGGALRYDNDPVWSRIVALAGGEGSRFVVLATAAANPEESAARVIEALQRHGASAVHVAVAPRIAGIDVAQAEVGVRGAEDDAEHHADHDRFQREFGDVLGSCHGPES